MQLRAPLDARWSTSYDGKVQQPCPLCVRQMWLRCLLEALDNAIPDPSRVRDRLEEGCMLLDTWHAKSLRVGSHRNDQLVVFDNKGFPKSFGFHAFWRLRSRHLIARLKSQRHPKVARHVQLRLLTHVICFLEKSTLSAQASAKLDCLLYRRTFSVVQRSSSVPTDAPASKGVKLKTPVCEAGAKG